MRIHTYIIVLLLMCVLGGVCLLGGIEWLNRDVERCAQKAANQQLLSRDFDRFEGTFRHWMVVSDLILGSDVSHLLQQQELLTASTRSRFERLVALDIGRGTEREAAAVQSFIGDQAGRLGRAAKLSGENRQQQLEVLLEEMDEQSGPVMDALTTLRSKTTGRLATLQWEQVTAAQRRSTWTILLGVVYAVYMLLIWIWTSRTLSRPLLSLAREANDAFDADKRANLATAGPGEVRELSASLMKLVGSLESRVAQRTDHLNVALQEVKQASQAKSAFLANMSHEMRTPMHGILSFASLGRKQSVAAGAEQMQRYFDRIDTCSRRLMTLLNDLLDLAKLESGTIQLSQQDTNLRSLTEQVVAEFTGLAEEANKTISVAPGQPNMVWGDPHKLMQVIRNLIGNALKFSPDGATVIVAIREVSQEDTPMLLLVVEDCGFGIPDSELASIFEKFVQSTRTDSGAGGTGLGLAISKEIIELHEGRIWAENRPEGGARFSVALPVRGPTEVGSAPVATMTSAVAGVGGGTEP